MISEVALRTLIMKYFLMGHKKDQFVVQRINTHGELVDKLDTKISPSDSRINMNLSLAVDKNNQNGIIVAMGTYEGKDRTLYNFLFDFEKKSVISSTPVPMDKSYRKSLQTTSTPNSATSNIPIEGMKPLVVLQAADQFIVLKDITGSGQTSTGSVDAAQMIVVSFYDHNLHLLGKLGIDKAFEYYWTIGCSFGYHLDGNKLHILTAANTNREHYVNVKATIDCSTRKFAELKEIPCLDNGRRKFCEGVSTLWFRDQYVISQLTDIGVVVQTAKTVFEVNPY